MKTVVYTQRVEVIDTYRERRDCADQRIADFLYTCGFLPVPLPNKAELAEKLVQAINPCGILLTGGNSLVAYGGNATERDEMDRELIQLALKKRIPLYGFCRGMQSILDYFGNPLSEVKEHVAVRHTIEMGQQFYEVNSYHNQACFQLKQGCGLSVLAKTEDGVIEAVHHIELPIFGTMWHPERDWPYSMSDIIRVKELFC